MTLGLADPLRYIMFGVMNTGKANNSARVDRKERGVVAGLQLKNAISDILDFSKSKTGKIADGLKEVSNGIHSARNGSKIFDGVCKGVNFVAGKLINPILIVASCVRAWKANDKKSAAIRECGAMTFMLLGEYAYKKLFGLGGHSAGYKKIPQLVSAEAGLKTLIKNTKYLNKLPLGKFGVLLKALGFIATSCGMFAIGGHAGKAVADRTTAPKYNAKVNAQSNPEYTPKYKPITPPNPFRREYIA